MSISKIYSVSDDEFRKIIANNKNYSDCLRAFGLSTLGTASRLNLKKRIKELNIDISHFNPYANFVYHPRKDIKPISFYLVKNSKITPHAFKDKFVKEGLLPYKCSICGNDGNWQGKKLVLQLDHINGNNTDNRIENLRFLCPNCHSQTNTYCGRNNKYLKQFEKPEIKKLCPICKNVFFTKYYNQKFCSYKCLGLYHRKVKRPSLEQLEQDLIELKHNFCAIGRKYGVSDNAVRKWLKYYKKINIDD